MIKLKKIISHLDKDTFNNVEETLIKNKADNFLYLLQSYRKEVEDNVIIEKLNLNANSFYVLKSRLYDRIQDHLSGDIYVNQEELLKKLNQIPDMCMNEPREVATAFLQKLEKDLLQYDMHSELLIVYSALKKMHLYSEKYFHYSQLYNKHIAFSLSLEKSEETLGNFNRVLGQYNFSRSPKYLETLFFLRKEINDHYALNQSRQVDITKNIIELQLCIFCHSDLSKETNVEDLLSRTYKIMNELPDSSTHKKWLPVLDHLSFEYYLKIGQSKYAKSYFEKVNVLINSLLLMSNICTTSKFLISKIAFLNDQGQGNELINEDPSQIIYDANDMHSRVILGIYSAMCSYYANKLKEAANKLNTLLNENSFKDFFHVNTDIKLTLAFIYIELKEYDLADSIIKGIYRKIKTEKITTYANVLDLIKVFELDTKQNNGKVSDKQKDYYTLFAARNKNESEILKHLVHELNKKYN
jgi:hypothetical protein